MYKGSAVHLYSGNLTSNCSTTPLVAGATFTGTWEATDGVATVVISLLTDQAGTLYMEQSADTTQVDSTLTAKVAANSKETQKLAPTLMYYRTRYVNGSSPQTSFRLQTRTGHEGLLSSLLSGTVQSDAPAIIVRTVDTELSLAQGRLQGYSLVNKMGKNSDVDTGTVPEDVWEGGGVYTGFPTGSAETVQIFSSSANDTAAGTGARTVRVIGLDANYAVQSETLTLNGVTPAVSTNTFSRIHTASVQSAGSGNFNAGIITCRHSTTTANVFFNMSIGINQTNTSAYTVPAGHTAWVRRLHGTIRGGATATADASLWTRIFGAAPRLRRPFALSSAYQMEDNIYGGIMFPEKTDLMVRITFVSANNIDVAAGYDIVLVED